MRVKYSKKWHLSKIFSISFAKIYTLCVAGIFSEKKKCFGFVVFVVSISLEPNNNFRLESYFTRIINQSNIWFLNFSSFKQQSADFPIFLRISDEISINYYLHIPARKQQQKPKEIAFIFNSENSHLKVIFFEFFKFFCVKKIVLRLLSFFNQIQDFHWEVSLIWLFKVFSAFYFSCRISDSFSCLYAHWKKAMNDDVNGLYVYIFFLSNLLRECEKKATNNENRMLKLFLHFIRGIRWNFSVTSEANLKLFAWTFWASFQFCWILGAVPSSRWICMIFI